MSPGKLLCTLWFTPLASSWESVVVLVVAPLRAPKREVTWCCVNAHFFTPHTGAVAALVRVACGDPLKRKSLLLLLQMATHAHPELGGVVRGERRSWGPLWCQGLSYRAPKEKGYACESHGDVACDL